MAYLMQWRNRHRKQPPPIDVRQPAAFKAAPPLSPAAKHPPRQAGSSTDPVPAGQQPPRLKSNAATATEQQRDAMDDAGWDNWGVTKLGLQVIQAPSPPPHTHTHTPSSRSTRGKTLPASSGSRRDKRPAPFECGSKHGQHCKSISCVNRKSPDAPMPKVQLQANDDA